MTTRVPISPLESLPRRFAIQDVNRPETLIHQVYNHVPAKAVEIVAQLLIEVYNP
jgi:hypothetical protein